MAEEPTPAEEAPQEEPTAVTVGDRLAHAIARHVMAAREAAAVPEQEARTARLNGIAEEMVAELKPMLGPMVAEMRAVIPDGHPARPLIEGLQSPTNPVIAFLVEMVGLVGFWLGALGTIGTIYLQPYKNELWSNSTFVPLSPPDVANMVVQGYMTREEGQGEAGYSGVNDRRFDLLVDVEGMPPSPQDAFEMFRRDIMPLGTSPADFPSVYAALAQGHTKDEWIAYFSKLAHVRPTFTDWVAAAVREQVPYDIAVAWATAAGLDTTSPVTTPPKAAAWADPPAGAPASMFDVLFDVSGRPPAPGEGGRMVHRGIIPEWTGGGDGPGPVDPKATSFQQLIAESDLKTKWTDALFAIQAYLPTIGEATQMYRHGFIDGDTFDTLLAKNGVGTEYQAALRGLAIVEQTAEERILSKNEVLQLFIEQVIDEPTAKELLAPLGYQGQVADYLITFAVNQRLQRQLDRLLEQISRAYVTGKISVTDAQTSLEHFGLPDAQVAGLLADWETAKRLEIPVATAAEIATYVYYGIESPDDGMTDITALGYSPYMAWRILSGRIHAPVKETDIPSFPGATTRPAGAQI